MNELELYEKIEALQRRIQTFVTDIGYDFEKFKNHEPGQKRKKPSPPLATSIASKISALYEEHSVGSDDLTDAFQLLPSAAKLELYTFLAENSSATDNRVDLSELQVEVE